MFEKELEELKYKNWIKSLEIKEYPDNKFDLIKECQNLLLI